jgi:ribonuclease BN (tRNA processing enzyme)
MLYLIHYPTGRYAKGDIAAEASRTYKGEIIIAKDFMTIEI